MRPLAVTLLVAGAMAAVPASRSQTTENSPGAQSPSRPATTVAAKVEGYPTPDLPIVSVEFKDTLTVPGIPNEHVFQTPISCSPDGVPFVNFPQPPDFMSNVVYSLDPNGAKAFSVHQASDLYDPIFQGYFVGSSVVGILVHATKDGKKASYSMTIVPGMPARDVYPGEHHDYLVEFDKNGLLKKVVDLPTSYHFWRIAELGDGNLLSLAYDQVNSVARLFLMDPDGEIIRPIELPAEMTETHELVQGQSGGMLNQARAESSMSWWLFALVGPKVLLYKAHSKAPLLEVGPGGAVRVVPLETPKGYTIEDVIPSTNRWIFRFRKDGIPAKSETDARPDADNYALYEFNQSDGTPLRRIHIAKGPVFSIACERNGVLTGFSMAGEKMLLKTADLPR